jgi:hypothetical protein
VPRPVTLQHFNTQIHNQIMKIKFHIAASVSTVLTLHSALGQGALTPPGAPAPVMKSLDQIEARTIVNSANTPGDGTNLFIISQPGSYYLTANVVPFRFLGGTAKNGIEITANNVTLDLNGFAMQGAMGIAGFISPMRKPTSRCGMARSAAGPPMALTVHPARLGTRFLSDSISQPAAMTASLHMEPPPCAIAIVKTTLRTELIALAVGLSPAAWLTKMASTEFKWGAAQSRVALCS